MNAYNKPQLGEGTFRLFAVAGLDTVKSLIAVTKKPVFVRPLNQRASELPVRAAIPIVYQPFFGWRNDDSTPCIEVIVNAIIDGIFDGKLKEGVWPSR